MFYYYRSNSKIVTVISLISLILFGFLNHYYIIFTFGKAETAYSHRSYNTVTTDNFIVYYNKDIIGIGIEEVLRECDESLEFLMEKLPFNPGGRIMTVIYPSYEEITQRVPGGRGKGAVGVFANSSIRILAPHLWMDDINEFNYKNPILHELTHLAVDRITKGNYPLWLTEGIALYMEALGGKEEWQYYGYFDIKEMEQNFINLNPYLSYGHALKLTRLMVEAFGEGFIYDLLIELGRGISFHEAFNVLTKEDFYEFVKHYEDEGYFKNL